MQSFFKKLFDNSFLYILLIIIFSIFYTTKIHTNGLLIYGEEQGFLNYDYVNYRYQSLWNYSNNFGSISFRYFNIFTMGNIWKISYFFGLNQLQTQLVFFFIFIFLSSLFSYLCFNTINKNKFLSLIISLIYISSYNYFSSISTPPKLIHYLIMPMSVFFWSKYRFTKKSVYILLNTILLILLISIGINLPQMISCYLLIFIFIITCDNVDNKLKKLLIFTFPYIINMLFIGSTYLIVASRNSDLFYFDNFANIWAAKSSRIHEIFRFFGGWWDYAGHNGIMYNHLSDYYHSYYGIIITYIPFMLLLLLIINSRNRKRNLQVLSLILIFIFLSKGESSPLGFIYNSFFEINIFKIFREPWAKFMPNFIFSVYLGIIILFEKKNNFNKCLIYVMLVVVFIFQITPIAKGKILPHDEKGWRLNDVKIPQYWIDLSNYSKNNLEDKRVLVLPSKKSINTDYVSNWKPIPYSGSPEIYLLYANIISHNFSDPEDQKIMLNYLNNLNPDSIPLGAIDYVLYKNDIKINNKIDYMSLSSVSAALQLDKKISFGKLDLYPIKEEYLKSKIRTVDKIYLTKDTCDFSIYNNEIGQSYVFIDNDNKIDKEIEKTKINVKRINETIYKITFDEKVKKDVGLLFTEKYNKGWKIYSSDSIFAKPINSTFDQSPGNCFSNFWVIPKDIVSKNKTIYIAYEPQKIFDIFKLSFIVIMSSYLLLIMFAKKNKPPMN